MTGLDRLSRDGMLRSSWQVLAVYTGASWIVLQVVDVLKDSMGLHDRVFPFSVVCLLTGLPIMLVTAVIQGRPGLANSAMSRAIWRMPPSTTHSSWTCGRKPIPTSSRGSRPLAPACRTS